MSVSPRHLLAAAIVSFLLQGELCAQGGVVISAGGPPTQGSVACVQIHAPGGTVGACVTVELNGVVLRTTSSSVEFGVLEVCFTLPPGCAGADLEITATVGGVTATNTYVVR